MAQSIRTSMQNLKSVAQKITELFIFKFVAAWGSHQNKIKIHPNLPDSLNCYFFIVYLGSTDHEMDFEINLFFSSQRWWNTFFSLPYIITIDHSYRGKKEKILSVRTTPPKMKKKMFNLIIICFRVFWAFFKNLLRCFWKMNWDEFPTLAIFCWHP